MDQKEMLKMAVISGASHALDYVKTHKRATDDEAIQHVTREMDEILSKINKEE